jgi:hypothetical protein
VVVIALAGLGFGVEGEAGAQRGAGLFPAYDVVTGTYGYIDAHGTMIIGPRFTEAQPFSEGLAAVADGQTWGYIDRFGEMAIPAWLDEASAFSDGLAAVESSTKLVTWTYR